MILFSLCDPDSSLLTAAPQAQNLDDVVFLGLSIDTAGPK